MAFGANVLAPGVRGLRSRRQIESLGRSAAFKSTWNRSRNAPLPLADEGVSWRSAVGTSEDLVKAPDDALKSAIISGSSFCNASRKSPAR